MKSITLDPLGVERLGERKSFFDWRDIGVKGGVKAGDLRRIGKLFRKCRNAPQIVGLMQWGKGIEMVQRPEHFFCHHHRFREAVSPMDDAVGYGSNRDILGVVLNQGFQYPKGRLQAILIVLYRYWLSLLIVRVGDC